MITIDQIAKELEISRTTARNLVINGVIPSIKIGKIYRVRKEDFLQFLQENTIGK